MSIVYVSIGNSDDKLPQSNWAEFQVALYDTVRKQAEQVHGVWYSDSTSEFQNACVCADVPDALMWQLREELEGLAADFGQDSIALAIAQTEFIKPRAPYAQTGVEK